MKVKKLWRHFFYTFFVSRTDAKTEMQTLIYSKVGILLRSNQNKKKFFFLYIFLTG